MADPSTVEVISKASTVGSTVNVPALQATPVVTPEPVVAPVVVPAVEIAPVVEKPVEEASKAHETILGVEPPKEEAPKEETKNTSEVKPEDKENASIDAKENTDGGQSDEPAPPPEVKYDPFTLPDDIKLEDNRVKEFTDLLSGLELEGKADHATVQKFGQKAVEFHVNELQKYGENLTRYYQQTWEKTKNDWKESFLKDPEIGGNRFQTTVDAAQTFIRTHGGTPEQQKEFRDTMESTGLGNHPAVIRLLANAQIAYSEGKPLTAVKPVSTPKSKITTMYGNS